MNAFIEMQCKNMEYQVQVFKRSCEISAKKDDGKISKDEASALKKINRASEDFAKELENVIKSY